MPALALSRISSLIILEAANFWNRHPSNNCLPPGTWECFLRHFLLPHFNFSSINNVQSTNDDRPFPEAQNLWNTRLLHWTYDRNNSYHSQWICRITGNSRLQKVHSFQWQDHTLTEKLHLALVPGPRERGSLFAQSNSRTHCGNISSTPRLSAGGVIPHPAG